MDSTRISLARVLELGLPLSWREAAAIVHEAIVLTGPTKGTRPLHVAAEECVITRGGEVTLIGPAAKARPETIVRLLEDLLPACDSPGGLGAAYERGMAIAFLEDLSQRTTSKRRRVEIAAVAIRAISAEADRAREADEGASFDSPVADVVPPLPAQITPRAPYPEVPLPQAPTAISHVTPFVAPRPPLKAVPPPVLESAADVAPPEFDRLRAAVMERDEARAKSGLQALLERLRELEWKKVAAGAVPVVLLMVWWLWPAGPPVLPPTPKQYDPMALVAIPLAPGWADIDRLGRAARGTRTAATTAVAATSPAPLTVAARSADAPAIVAEPRADASVALVPPAGEIPATASAPGARPAPPPPPVAAAVLRPTAAVPALAAAEDGESDTVYSWTSDGVEPPVIRSPAMPSWAMPAPTATIDGPYLEVLVGQQGQVETVRVRGRIEPGETFYRHRMMLASAKLWQFAPARLNGRPVRYVVRVLLDQP